MHGYDGSIPRKRLFGKEWIMHQKAPTAWMWADAGNVYGLSIDLETRTLRWFANAGCLCDHDDSTVDQSPTTFLAHGVPGAVAEPPADVRAEVEDAAQRLAAQG
jgi:hypothetical protein